MKKINKSFDCVEMKRRIQENIYEETKNLTSEELIAYFHQRVAKGPFGELWKRGLERQRQRQDLQD